MQLANTPQPQVDHTKPYPPSTHTTVATVANNTHINDKLGKYIQADSSFIQQFSLAKLMTRITQGCMIAV